MALRHVADCPCLHHAKFGDNNSKGGRVIAIFYFSKWRPAAILDFDTGQKWRYGTLQTAHVYHRAKFGDNSSNGGRVIAFCGKIQNGSVCHFEFVFGNSGHPRSSLMDLKLHRKFGVSIELLLLKIS